MITEDIRYIGVNDHDIDLFEGQYQVPNGISYNSYVIMDEKIAIMDTVDKRKQTEFLENLETALAGRSRTGNHALQRAEKSLDPVVVAGSRRTVSGNHIGRQCEDISDAETVL